MGISPRIITCYNEHTANEAVSARSEDIHRNSNHLLVISNPRSAKQPRSTPSWLRPSVFTFLRLGIAGRHIVIHVLSLKVQLPRVQIFYQITHVSSDFLQCRGIYSWPIFQGHVGFQQGKSKGAGEEKGVTRT